MKVVEKYSHLNGEEYLLVHHPDVLKEILSTVKEIETSKFKTKKSEEKTMSGKLFYNPDALNREFKRIFTKKDGAVHVMIITLQQTQKSCRSL